MVPPFFILAPLPRLYVFSVFGLAPLPRLYMSFFKFLKARFLSHHRSPGQGKGLVVFGVRRSPQQGLRLVSVGASRKVDFLEQGMIYIVVVCMY